MNTMNRKPNERCSENRRLVRAGTGQKGSAWEWLVKNQNGIRPVQRPKSVERQRGWQRGNILVPMGGGIFILYCSRVLSA